MKKVSTVQLPQSKKKGAQQQSSLKAIKTTLILNKPFNPDDYVTPTLLRDEIIEIRQAFQIFDTENRGVISSSGLKKQIIDLGFTGENKFIYQILAQLDEDEDVGIDFSEFLRLATARIGQKDNRQQISKVFTAFDLNNQGKFTVQQLKTVIQELGEDFTNEQIQHMFKKADLDDDGFVTMDDFYNIITHKVYWDQR